MQFTWVWSSPQCVGLFINVSTEVEQCLDYKKQVFQHMDPTLF